VLSILGTSLCKRVLPLVADMATGFAFDKNRKELHSANFKADGKYFVSKPSELIPGLDLYLWQVTQVGTIVPESMCENNFNHGVLVCNTGVSLFRMSSRTLRFMLIYQMGYVIDGTEEMKEGENTPYMAIGKCSPL
jgi:hypothetical protein